MLLTSTCTDHKSLRIMTEKSKQTEHLKDELPYLSYYTTAAYRKYITVLPTVLGFPQENLFLEKKLFTI